MSWKACGTMSPRKNDARSKRVTNFDLPADIGFYGVESIF
jgi:hypothetical protein